MLATPFFRLILRFSSKLWLNYENKILIENISSFQACKTSRSFVMIKIKMNFLNSGISGNGQSLTFGRIFWGYIFYCKLWLFWQLHTIMGFTKETLRSIKFKIFEKLTVLVIYFLSYLGSKKKWPCTGTGCQLVPSPYTCFTWWFK